MYLAAHIILGLN